MNKPQRHSMLARLRVCDPARSDEVLTQLACLRESTLAEPGCLRFDIFGVTRETGQLLLLEAFVDTEAFSRHLQAAHTQAYFALKLTEVVECVELEPVGLDA